MYAKIIIMIMLACILPGLSGCFVPVKPPKPKTEIQLLYANHFTGLKIPEIEEIKASETSKNYPYVTFDEVWESVILVLMQQGIIVRSLKETGIIVAVSNPHLALFVERDELASFEITDETLENLRTEGVPEDVLETLESLKDQVFIGLEKFLQLLHITFGDEQADHYKGLILKYTGESVNVYYSWMETLYTSELPEGIKPYELNPVFNEPEVKEQIVKSFFDRVSTQVYSGQKWGYLYQTISQE